MPYLALIAFWAASACPNVSATIAMPVGIRATSMTPGIVRRASSSKSSTVPRTCGARATMAGFAPGTSRSQQNLVLPVM